MAQSRRECKGRFSLWTSLSWICTDAQDWPGLHEEQCLLRGAAAQSHTERAFALSRFPQHTGWDRRLVRDGYTHPASVPALGQVFPSQGQIMEMLSMSWATGLGPKSRTHCQLCNISEHISCKQQLLVMYISVAWTLITGWSCTFL